MQILIRSLEEYRSLSGSWNNTDPVRTLEKNDPTLGKTEILILSLEKNGSSPWKIQFRIHSFEKIIAEPIKYRSWSGPWKGCIRIRNLDHKKGWLAEYYDILASCIFTGSDQLRRVGTELVNQFLKIHLDPIFVKGGWGSGLVNYF